MSVQNLKFSLNHMVAPKMTAIELLETAHSLSINTLYPFNIWNDERAGQAEKLAELAAACGAVGLAR